MITVSADFKTAMKAQTRVLYATVAEDGEMPDTITESDDLKSVKISASSGLMKSVMRMAEFSYLGSHSYLDKYVHIGIGCQLVANAITVFDDFAGDEINASVWNTFGTGVSVDNGLIIAVNGASPQYTGITSDNTIDLTGHEIVASSVDAGNTAIESWEVYPLKLYLDDNNYIEYVIAGGNLLLRYKAGGVTTTVDTIVYSTEDHAGLKIREMDGTIYFDAYDGSVWTNIGSDTNPFDLTALRVDVLVGMWQTEASNTALNMPTIEYHTTQVTEAIDYGMFWVVSEEVDQVTGVTTAKCFDQMYFANEQYGLTPTYPLTLFEFVEDICTELGWTLGVASFPNDDISLTAELFSESKLTYRQILDMVAEASGSIIYFSNNELLFRQVEISTAGETLGLADMFSVKLENKYTDINQLVGSRMPQEDNVLVKDDANIALNGIKEIRIVNNYIIDDDRETYLPVIFAELLGLNFYPCECRTVGLGYFEIGDRISVPNSAGTGHHIVVMEYEIVMDGALRETLKCFSPDLTYTNTSYAGIIGQAIKNTEIIVNKQQGEIDLINLEIADIPSIPKQAEPPESPETNDLYMDTDDNLIYRYDGTGWVASGISGAEFSLTTSAINSTVTDLSGLVSALEVTADTNSEDIETLTGSVSDLEQTATALELSIEQLGGVNLLKNSVGLKGTIEEWQELDGNGDPLDADNDGTIVQTSDVELNSESGSAISITDQYILQTINTIEGELYTVYCRFKKTDTTNVNITGIGDVELAGDDDVWTVFKYQFTAGGSSTTIKFITGALVTCVLTDMVVKIGDCSGWTPAPNEVYGANYRFDKDGFQITSLTDTFKSLLDNTKFAVYDTAGGDRIIMYVSKDQALITQATLQEQLTVQRYENSASALRIIPVDDGAFFVIND